MEIPDRECPNAWEDCRDCEFALNVTCPKIKAERAEMQKIADVTEVRSIKQAHKDAKKLICGSSPQALIYGPSKNLWAWWGKSSPVDPQNITREPVMAMSGAIEFSGGSKSGKHHKTAPKTIPEYLKTWGT